LAAANLQAEKVPGEVHVTGNTAVDALLATLAELPAPSLREKDMPPILVTCHRRESWGEGLRSIAAAIAELARDAHVQLILHPNPHVSAQMRSLLSGLANVSLLEPCGHRELLALVREADLVLSDSGGLQEEAPTLGVPLLVLREKTERPEGIASGNARLVGTQTERIVAEARRLLADPVARAAMSRQSFPYGDGRAALRIAAIAAEWLDRRSKPALGRARQKS
jgi:UDP-N-acetylglucosamine 2-epimerase (non-hydrolysing)